MINEAAVREFGWDEPLGKRLNRNGQVGPVIGVLDDFHFASLHQAIEPVVLYMEPEDYGYLSLKLETTDVQAALAEIEATWREHVPTYPFDYAFLDDTFDRLYRTDYRFGWIFGAFAFLAIAIACLGLFGLAAFMAEQRTKEIGIRKVLGASVPDILLLMSKHFVGLVLVAAVLATPVVYLVMNRWLADFAYRVALSWWLFPTAALAVLALAWLTVSYQSTRAALTDPVQSLRHE